MDYKQALKTVQSRKQKDNFLVVSLSYSLKVVLPYKAGIALLDAMSSAEQFDDNYSRKAAIKELDQGSFTVTPMSGEEYERIKIAALLGVTPDEVKEFALRIE